MGKKTPAPPRAPDPAATAAAQGAINKETAIAQAELNMINQQTPFGSLEFTQRGTSAEGTPQYEATQTLAPEQQTQLDLANEAARRFGGLATRQLTGLEDRLGEPLTFGSGDTTLRGGAADEFLIPGAPTANEDTRQQVAQSIYDRNARFFDRDEDRLRTELANRGFVEGTEAYRREMDEFGRRKNDFLLGADVQAGNEMSRLFGLEGTARDRAINEMVTQRTQPLNELVALTSGTQVQGPSFINPPQTGLAAADIVGPTAMQHQSDMARFNAQQQNNQSFMSNLFGLGGALGSAWIMSDRDKKTDIVPADEESALKAVEGMPVSTWRYKGDDKRRIGPMAQDFPGSNGEAIDPASAFGLSFAAIKALSDRLSELEGRRG